jgi:hypothetical protein
MYLEMPLVNDTTGAHPYRSDAVLPSSSEAERERLVALLQCAYSWSRVQALRQVDKWMLLEAGNSPRSAD